jgi:hypothetical protein
MSITVPKIYIKVVSILFFVFLILLCYCHKNDEIYLEPENVSKSHGRSENPSIATDSKNTVYLFWDDDTYGNEEILYVYKPANESWTAPINVSNNSEGSRFPAVAIDKYDIIHLAWQQMINNQWKILYRYKDTINAWSIPETISVYGASLNPVISVDNDQGLHLLWQEGFSPEQCLLYYGYKPYRDTWQIKYLLTIPICDYEIKTDINNGVHIVLDPYSEIYYIEKKPNGIWSDTVRLSHTPTDWYGSILPSMAIDNQGRSHVVWAEGDTALRGFVYIKGNRAFPDSWTSPINPYRKNYNWLLTESKIGIGKSGKIYVVWRDVQVGIGYGIKNGENWMQPKIIVKRGTGQHPSLAIDAEECIHFTWEAYDSSSVTNKEIYYVEIEPSYN